MSTSTRLTANGFACGFRNRLLLIKIARPGLSLLLNIGASPGAMRGERSVLSTAAHANTTPDDIVRILRKVLQYYIFRLSWLFGRRAYTGSSFFALLLFFQSLENGGSVAGDLDALPGLDDLAIRADEKVERSTPM